MFFFQAEDGIRDLTVTGVQTCALPISAKVDLFEANLREPEVTQLHWSDERLAAIKEQLRLSIRSMKAYLVDPAANVGTTADFAKTEHLRICKRCNFPVVCRPELT